MHKYAEVDNDKIVQISKDGFLFSDMPCNFNDYLWSGNPEFFCKRFGKTN